MLCKNHLDKNHPSTFVDGLIIHSSYFSAFASITQMKKWFGKWLRVFGNVNFVIVSYLVDEKHICESKSGRQIAFRKDKAKRKRIVQIKDWLASKEKFN
jgi:hypothetical protein